MKDVHNPLPGVPKIESPFFSKFFNTEVVDAETLRIALELNTRGYAVIDFPDAEISNMAEEIKQDLDKEFEWEGWRKFGFENEISLRVQDAWKFNKNVHRIATNPKILDLLSQLYGRRAWPFQTLNFPVGTQQHFHTDSIHFSSMPERFMCGVWVALEDITMESGPLVYYPGTHKWPVYTNEFLGICATELAEHPHQKMYEPLWRELVEHYKVEPEHFTAKKGQALIWTANLLHGGSKQQDPNKTRWSQVTHYYFENCSYYSPLSSDPFYGTINFKNVTNLITQKRTENLYCGHTIPKEFVDAVRYKGKVIDPNFNSAAYLRANPDVAKSGVDAEWHWENYGKKEGRSLGI
ncbi:phytanoyl-CoA dioxygenase family protein [Pseudomonas juntendi]|uniref:Phytanoyl-CoA dioxygenase n=1 Tax=Pseudomonas putida TaxID=303 RepID=A0A7H5R5L0_PSEPU|nr:MULTISPECIES: phytanoyl-CoA dioxygenase family protein [Pseudomonas]ELU0815038.1 phytanoyl-CoA dioxygenase family protein [Pseudomonas putida]KAF0256806.1 phytanoyl-CoA dioxygenase [Pseudomonas putida]MDH2017302.1 phytanoyl-CoA dioxygenase family protein [Pseudomonas juntendi]QJQ11301.1 phytanoyl-CoA dioxygenase family protein [Pseudomonas putida]WQE53419.1 phytanoyl-CoA dioxygenase family protein [Pseudomonas putida]